MEAPGAYWIIEPPPLIEPADGQMYSLGSVPIDLPTNTDDEIRLWRNLRLGNEHIIRVRVWGHGESSCPFTYDLEKKTRVPYANPADAVLEGFGKGWAPDYDGNPFFKVSWEGEFRTISYYRLVGFPIPQKWKKVTYPIFSGTIQIFRRRTGEVLSRVSVKAMDPSDVGRRISESHTGRFLFWEDRADPEHPKIFVFHEEKPSVPGAPQP